MKSGHGCVRPNRKDKSEYAGRFFQIEFDSTFIPKVESKLHYVIPNLGIDEVGDFSVTYDMTCVDEIDYYRKSPYSAYNHADQPVIEIENELADSGESVLIIHDSYYNCVIPFLSLDIKDVISLDVRHFTGSVEKYIMEEKPDL